MAGWTSQSRQLLNPTLIQPCYPFTAQRGLLGFPALRHSFIFNTRHSQPSRLDMAAGSRAWRIKPSTMQKVKTQVVQQFPTPTCPHSAHWRSLRRPTACAPQMFQTRRHLWDTPRNIYMGLGLLMCCDLKFLMRFVHLMKVQHLQTDLGRRILLLINQKVQSFVCSSHNILLTRSPHQTLWPTQLRARSTLGSWLIH